MSSKAAAQGSTTLIVRAKRAAENGESDEARQLLDRLSLAALSPEEIRQVAKIYVWCGATPRAILAYRHYLRLQPDDSAAKLELARILGWSDFKEERQQALRLLDEYIIANTDNREALLLRARIRTSLGASGASEDYRDYLNSDKTEDRIQLELASALSWSGDKQDMVQAVQIYDAHLTKHPNNDAIRLARARVLSWIGDIERSAKDYSYYLGRHPKEKKTELEFARTLTWSANAKHLRRAKRLYDKFIAKDPNDWKLRLARAEVLGRLRQITRAATEYERYLKTKPNDTKVRLRLANTLTWSKKTRHLIRALGVFDAHLAAHPKDLKTRLQRARVSSWIGRTGRAISDYQAYFGDRPRESKLRLEYARVLADAGRLRQAMREFRSLKNDPQVGHQAQLGWARTLLWQGEYVQAERWLISMTKQQLSSQLRNDVHLELARLYAQTERPLLALRILDRLIDTEKGNEALINERRLIGRVFRPTAATNFFAYAEKADINIYSSWVDGELSLGRHVRLLAHAALWHLRQLQEDLFAERLDVGVRLFWESYRLDAMVGSRFYEGRDPRFGVRAQLGGRPATWASFTLDYSYDDVFQQLFQPATVSRDVHGSTVAGRTVVTFPYRITAAARLASRFLEPHNIGLDFSGSLEAPVWRGIWLGYLGQWIGWRRNDPSYWSPQSFAAHIMNIRYLRTFNDLNLATDVQLGVGTAFERVDGDYETDYGLAVQLGGSLTYTPTKWLSMGANFQYSQTARNQFPLTAPGVIEADSEAQDITYWWVLGQLWVKVVL